MMTFRLGVSRGPWKLTAQTAACGRRYVGTRRSRECMRIEARKCNQQQQHHHHHQQQQQEQQEQEQLQLQLQQQQKQKQQKTERKQIKRKYKNTKNYQTLSVDSLLFFFLNSMVLCAMYCTPTPLDNCDRSALDVLSFAWSYSLLPLPLPLPLPLHPSLLNFLSPDICIKSFVINLMEFFSV